MMIRKIFNKKICVFMLLLLLVAELFISAFPVTAVAEGEIVSYDKTPIEDDLASMKTENYPANSLGECSVVGFMEYCYSENEKYSSYYGLYVYVYNPTGKRIILREGANTLQLSNGFKEDGGKSGTFNYPLTYLDNTDDHLFYKFKLSDPSEQYDIAKEYARLWNGRRRYEITAVNILFEGQEKDKTSGVSKVYEFSGYSAYCDESASPNSTLQCINYGGEDIHLEVKDTNYRFAEKPDERFIHDDLQSVYFAIPDNYYEEFGNLTAITAEWYQERTQPIFVTSDWNAYDSLYDARNIEINNKGYPYDKDGFIAKEEPISRYRVYWDEYIDDVSDVLGLPIFYYGTCYNGAAYGGPMDDDSLWDGFEYHFGIYDPNTGKLDKGNYNPCSRLDWIFYISDPDELDDYEVSSEEVKEYIKQYARDFPEQEKLYGIIPEGLVLSSEEYPDSGYKGGTIDLSDVGTVIDVANQTFWERFWNGVEYESITYAPFVTIEYRDLSLTPDEFSERYYVNKHDAEEIMDFAKDCYKNDQTPVVFRFAKTDYYASPARFDQGEDGDMSEQDGYVAQETLFFDFDILSLTFTSEDGYDETVIGVVADSIDIINGLTPPDDLRVEDEDWWQKIMMVICLILLIVLFTFFSGPIGFVLKIIFSALGIIFDILLWIIKLPFRLLRSIFGKK